MINLFLIYIINVLYSCLEGIREAYYYHSASKTGDSSEFNIHWVYFIQRAIFVFCSVYFVDFNILFKLCLFASIAISFPFFHDGSYYTVRNYLDSNTYPSRWEDSSVTSTARLELKFKERLIGFILGFVLLIFIICYDNFS